MEVNNTEEGIVAFKYEWLFLSQQAMFSNWSADTRFPSFPYQFYIVNFFFKTTRPIVTKFCVKDL